MGAVIGAFVIGGGLVFAFLQALQPSKDAVAVFCVAFVVALAVSAGTARR